jgi:hypothetical protein
VQWWTGKKENEPVWKPPYPLTFVCGLKELTTGGGGGDE